MTKKIVIVEDEPLLLKALNLTLQSKNYQTYCASSGENALPLIKNVTPDLILLDMLLPKLSGLEILDILQSNKKTQKIPVIILSNSDRKEDLKKAKSSNIVDYLVKANTDLKTIAEKVEKILKVKPSKS